MLSIYNPDNLEKWMHTNSTNTTVDERQCAICFEELADKTVQTTLECTHSFCTSCILRWFQTNNTCPCCRAEVPNVVPSRGGRNTQAFERIWRDARRRAEERAEERVEIIRRKAIEAIKAVKVLIIQQKKEKKELEDQLKKWRCGKKRKIKRKMKLKIRHRPSE